MQVVGGGWAHPTAGAATEYCPTAQDPRLIGHDRAGAPPLQVADHGAETFVHSIAQGLLKSGKRNQRVAVTTIC